MMKVRQCGAPNRITRSALANGRTLSQVVATGQGFSASGSKMIATKICTKCKMEKLLSEYSKKAARRDGLRCRCRFCTAEDDRERTLRLTKARLAHPITKTRKVCVKCGIGKPVSAFGKLANTHDGLGYRCQSCRSKKRLLSTVELQKRTQLERYLCEHPDSRAKTRDIRLRSKYGITLEQYDAMLIQQDSMCAICARRKWGVGIRSA